MPAKEELRLRQPCRLFTRLIHRGLDHVSMRYNLPSFVGPAVNSTSAIEAGTPFGNVGGILKLPSLNSRTPTAIVRETERFFRIYISHGRELLVAKFP
jgi:hypothetical protein